MGQWARQRIVCSAAICAGVAACLCSCPEGWSHHDTFPDRSHCLTWTSVVWWASACLYTQRCSCYYSTRLGSVPTFWWSLYLSYGRQDVWHACRWPMLGLQSFGVYNCDRACHANLMHAFLQCFRIYRILVLYMRVFCNTWMKPVASTGISVACEWHFVFNFKW
jgi:hypothetical protein